MCPFTLATSRTESLTSLSAVRRLAARSYRHARSLRHASARTSRPNGRGEPTLALMPLINAISRDILCLPLSERLPAVLYQRPRPKAASPSDAPAVFVDGTAHSGDDQMRECRPQRKARPDDQAASGNGHWATASPSDRTGAPKSLTQSRGALASTQFISTPAQQAVSRDRPRSACRA